MSKESIVCLKKKRKQLNHLVSSSRKTIIFRPHNLLRRVRKIMICVSAFFFQILPNPHFLLHFIFKLRFTNEEAEFRKQAFPFVPARYIRTFDVLSEFNSFSTEEAEVRKNCAIYELRFTKKVVNFQFPLSIEGGKYPYA